MSCAELQYNSNERARAILAIGYDLPRDDHLVQKSIVQKTKRDVLTLSVHRAHVCPSSTRASEHGPAEQRDRTILQAKSCQYNYVKHGQHWERQDVNKDPSKLTFRPEIHQAAP
jgi:hypothetical protein